MEVSLTEIKMRFGSFLEPEEFIVGIQSCMTEVVANPTDKGIVLKYASAVKDVVEAGIDDDGVNQSVAIKRGIVSKEVSVLPNPVTLRPYRTFCEVEQPASEFIFRVHEGPKFALFEADGGAWRNEAMQTIKSWIEEQTGGNLLVIS